MMRENARSAMIVVAGIVIVAVSAYGYGIASTSAIQALHNRYDTIIEAHVLIPPASASTLGQGHVSEIFTINTTSIDFGIVSPGTKSSIKGVLITNTGVIPTMYIHAATDLNTPGVTLTTAETKDLNIFTRKILNVVGTTYPSQLTESGARSSKAPAFQIEVAPNTAGMDLTFHIILSYCYLPP